MLQYLIYFTFLRLKVVTNLNYLTWKALENKTVLYTLHRRFWKPNNLKQTQLKKCDRKNEVTITLDLLVKI